MEETNDAIERYLAYLIRDLCFKALWREIICISDTLLISVMYYTCVEQRKPLFFILKIVICYSNQVMFCCEYFQTNIQKIPEEPNTEV